MMMWAGFACILVGLFEEIVSLMTFDKTATIPWLPAAIGVVFLLGGVALAIYDGKQGEKEREEILAHCRRCPSCGLQLTEDCHRCPSCGEEVG